MKKIIVKLIIILDILLYIVFPIVMLFYRETYAYMFFITLICPLAKFTSYRNIYNVWKGNYTDNVKKEVSAYIVMSVPKKGDLFYDYGMNKANKYADQFNNTKEVDDFIAKGIGISNLIVSTSLFIMLFMFAMGFDVMSSQ